MPVTLLDNFLRYIPHQRKPCTRTLPATLLHLHLQQSAPGTQSGKPVTLQSAMQAAGLPYQASPVLLPSGIIKSLPASICSGELLGCCKDCSRTTGLLSQM